MAKVKITDPANYDLIDIEYAISIDLCNYVASDRIIDGIIAKIESTSENPEMFQYVNDELLANLGIRMTWFDNYNIFYFYDKSDKTMHVLRILYNKVDWQFMLHRDFL